MARGGGFPPSGGAPAVVLLPMEEYTPFGSSFSPNSPNSCAVPPILCTSSQRLAASTWAFESSPAHRGTVLPATNLSIAPSQARGGGFPTSGGAPATVLLRKEEHTPVCSSYSPKSPTPTPPRPSSGQVAQGCAASTWAFESSPAHGVTVLPATNLPMAPNMARGGGFPPSGGALRQVLLPMEEYIPTCSSFPWKTPTPT